MVSTKMYTKYLWYVIRHKWFVLLECWRAGLIWRGLVHDLSKLRPSEFAPYANFFYGPTSEQVRDETGYYKPVDTGDLNFDRAWFLHQKRNDHHWQFWVLPKDEGGLKVLPMSTASRAEMLCDWRGAGRAQGTPDTLAWWRKNGPKMQLHPETRAWIERQFGVGEGEIDDCTNRTA